jgi:hypothetical protein
MALIPRDRVDAAPRAAVGSAAVLPETAPRRNAPARICRGDGEKKGAQDEAGRAHSSDC